MNPAEEIARLRAELSEARAEQAASASMLRAIASGPAQIDATLQGIVDEVARLVRVHNAGILLVDGDDLVRAAQILREDQGANIPIGSRSKLDRSTMSGRAILERRRLVYDDLQLVLEREYPTAYAFNRARGERDGVTVYVPRSSLTVPLVGRASALGALTLTRAEVLPFTDHEVALVECFVDQAVIAIENARLVRELEERNAALGESLDQQTALADVLRVIAASPTDVGAVLDAIALTASRLCTSRGVRIFRLEGDDIVLASRILDAAPTTELLGLRYPVSANVIESRVVREAQPIQIDDLHAPEFASDHPDQQVSGERSAVVVPLLSQGRAIGTLGLARYEVFPYGERDIALVQAFADQAVIAIENARLFRELEERNTELAAALQQQTVMSDVLQVIASAPTELRRVLDTIAASAARLCDIEDATVWLARGDSLVAGGHHGSVTLPEPLSGEDFLIPIRRGLVSGRAVLEARTIHVVDPLAEAVEYPESAEFARELGHGTVLATPLVRDGSAIGTLLFRRRRVQPFTDDQIRLSETFANQAVIAVENARLFRELEERNAALAEGLERERATGEILRVIASAPTDLDLVLTTLAEAVARLCGTFGARIYRVEGDEVVLVAAKTLDGPSRSPVGARQPLSAFSPVTRAMREVRTIHVEDMESAESYADYPDHLRTAARTMVAVPLVRNGRAIGAIGLPRREVRLFAPGEIAVAELFADQAVIAIENARLFRELEERNADLRELLEQQTVSAETLRAVASSPTDLTSVLETIGASAMRLVSADHTTVQYLQRGAGAGDAGELVALVSRNADGSAGEYVVGTRRGLDEHRPGPIAVRERRIVHVLDMQSADGKAEFPLSPTTANTLLVVPLLRDGEAHGALTLGRHRVKAFSDREIALVQSFADQAVIAIENARLFRELEERNNALRDALEQQTATADVLRVIAGAPTELDAVLDAIVVAAMRLCAGTGGSIWLADGDQMHAVAGRYQSATADHALTRRAASQPIPTSPDVMAGRAILEGRVIHTDDLLNDTRFPVGQRFARTSGQRSVVAIPLRRESETIGALVVGRNEVRPFVDHEQSLLSSFADQAVIAIENARLFRELEERNSALAVALERQTAMGEVLEVIASSPTDPRRVLDTICESAARLCRTEDAVVRMLQGDEIVVVGSWGEFGDEAQRANASLPNVRGSVSGRAIADMQTVQVVDPFESEDEFPIAAMVARTRGIRTILATPLIRDQRAIGVIGLRRKHVEAFTDDQIRLIETFANQAVIAIENARLFRELEERNSALRESLEQQTALANVLRVIASSPADLEPVLDSIAESAARLCDTEDVMIQRVIGDTIVARGHHGSIPIGALGSLPSVVRQTSIVGTALARREPVMVPDIQAAADDFAVARELSHELRIRTVMGIPLLRDGEPVGVFLLRRQRVEPFTESQIRLLETFADQAVIAIENARLFRELEERNAALASGLSREQATSAVLRVIAASPSNEEAVFEAILESVTRISRSVGALIYLREGDEYVCAAVSDALVGVAPVVGLRRSIDGREASATAIRECRTIHQIDAGSEQTLAEFPDSIVRHSRTVLTVPMQRGGEAVGLIVVTRFNRVQAFEPQEIALVETFADQAVIAIENARLFRELEERNAALTEGLERERATGEILRVIAGSPTDLPAVLETIASSVRRLCNTDASRLYLIEDGQFVIAGVDSQLEASRALLGTRSPLNSRMPATEAVLQRRTVHVHDLMSEATRAEFPDHVNSGGRTALYVPLIRDDSPLGVLATARHTVRALSDREVALAETFAHQAVIAIENTRLFRELEERVEELRALGEVGQAVSSSLNLQDVLETIVAHAVQLSGGDGGAVYELDEAAAEFDLRASYQMSDELVETLQHARPRLSDQTPPGRAALTREAVQVEDLEIDQGASTPAGMALARAGYRALLTVPLLRDQRAVGALVIRRKTPGRFAQPVVDLVQTFANQSVLAIENARLFNELQEASRHKSAFVASMSHELRTPLNAILSYSQLVREELEDLGQTELVPDLQRIHGAGQHLLGLINDILDLSKIEAGRMDLYLETFEIATLVAEAESVARPLVERNGNTLVVECAADLGSMHADQQKVRQVLLNLLSNAAKFTKDGTVTLRVQGPRSKVQRADDPTAQQESLDLGPLDVGRTSFAVVDTGIGMTPAQVGRLFEAFSQAEAGTSRQYGGTGLGLAISRQFCRLMGGDIEVESEHGRGSTFTAWLPARAVASTAEAGHE
jgi:GAF domain-containing protein